MDKRDCKLTVMLSRDEMLSLQRLATESGLRMSDWVRQQIRARLKQEAVANG